LLFTDAYLYKGLNQNLFITRPACPSLNLDWWNEDASAQFFRAISWTAIDADTKLIIT